MHKPDDDDLFDLPKGRQPSASPLADTPLAALAPSKRSIWLWPLAGTGFIGLVIAGGLLGYWAFWNVAARLLIMDQALTVRLPPEATITLKTKNDVVILMKGVIHAQVPLKQTLNIPISGSYATDIDLNTHVPLDTVITYEGVIPVDTLADIEAKAPVSFQNVKKFKNLHFKAKLPMKLRLPVKLVVPVHQNIPLRYHGPLQVRIDHTLVVPVDTILDTALKVNQTFSVPILSSLHTKLMLPQNPVHATITDADLYLDVSTLKLEKKPAEP